MITDEYFMNHALDAAKKAFLLGEVPVGAVAVRNGEIIASAHNEVEKQAKASAHAELLCLERAAAVVGDWRLSGVTLYSTLEPCAMCLGAMFLYRIDRLVWGASDLRHGALGSFCNLLEKPHPTHNLCVLDGVLKEASAHLLRTFFQKRRSCEKATR